MTGFFALGAAFFAAGFFGFAGALGLLAVFFTAFLTAFFTAGFFALGAAFLAAGFFGFAGALGLLADFFFVVVFFY